MTAQTPPVPAPAPDPAPADVRIDEPPTPQTPPAPVTPPAPAAPEPTAREKELMAQVETLGTQVKELAGKLQAAPPAPAPANDDDIEIPADFATLYGVDPAVVRGLAGVIIPAAEKRAMKKLRKDADEYISNSLNNHQSVLAARDQFYIDNPDLAKHKDLVQMVGLQVAKDHPDLKWGDGLKKVAEEARLKIKKLQDDISGNAPPTPPAVMPGGQGGQGTGLGPVPEVVNEIDDELADRRKMKDRALGHGPVK